MTPADRKASLDRGGDGRAARFDGGHLRLTGPAGLSGQRATILLRIRDARGAWDSPLISLDRPDDPLRVLLGGIDGKSKPRFYGRTGTSGTPTPFDHLFFEANEPRAVTGTAQLIEYRWRTQPNPGLIEAAERGQDVVNLPEARAGVLSIDVPVAHIGAAGWHDILVRFDGPKLELFVDGALVDEEWPYGDLEHFRTPLILGSEQFRGEIDHLALWSRALNDGEIIQLSGGAAVVRQRRREILGPPPGVPNYWRSAGYNTYAGDCMLMFHDGQLHLFYLHDRRHHHSKWGLGAHQFAHVSTRDLKNWTHHPIAVPISAQWEPAIGTGNVIYYQGRFYAFYTDCGARVAWPGKPGKLSGAFVAVSEDGIHFRKSLEPLIQTAAGCADNEVFVDPATGMFNLITPISIGTATGATNRYLSRDLRKWELAPEPIAKASGPCPHVFEWNGWHYFIVGGNVFYSRHPLGPWKPHDPARFDLAFPKAASFNGNRRLIAGWLGDRGWGGDVVFRELVQQPDGTLGTRFVEEMMPPTGSTITPEWKARDAAAHVENGRLSLQDGGSVAAGDIPPEVRITMTVRRLSSNTEVMLGLRGESAWGNAIDLPLPSAALPTGQSVSVDILMKGTIIDTCIGGRRTAISRHKETLGRYLRLTVKGGAAEIREICIRPTRSENDTIARTR